MAHVRREIILSLTILTIGCASSAPKSISTLPPNVMIFHQPYERVWKTVTETLTLKHLYALEVNLPQQGTFSTQLMREQSNSGPTRSRISGTVHPGPEGIVVTLYNQQEIFENGKWHAVQSSYLIEKNLLSEIKSTLQQ